MIRLIKSTSIEQAKELGLRWKVLGDELAILIADTCNSIPTSAKAAKRCSTFHEWYFKAKSEVEEEFYRMVPGMDPDVFYGRRPNWHDDFMERIKAALALGPGGWESSEVTMEPDLTHGVSTIAEVSKRFRHNAEYLRARECNLEGCLEFIQIADWLDDYQRIIASGNCNDCQNARDCCVKPELGKMVRFNCPDYENGRLEPPE